MNYDQRSKNLRLRDRFVTKKKVDGKPTWGEGRSAYRCFLEKHNTGEEDLPSPLV